MPTTSVERSDGAQVTVVDRGPAARQRIRHAHGDDALAVMSVGLHHRSAQARMMCHVARRSAARTLGQDRQAQQNQCAGKCRHAEPGMQQKTDDQKHRHPRQIDDGNGPRTGQEASDLIKVAHRLNGIPGIAALARNAHDGGVHGGAEMLVQQRCRAYHDAGADKVERTLEGIGADEEHRQRHQRWHTAARQHPVIHLQHVEGTSKHQQVHPGGEYRHAPERPPTVLQSSRDRRMYRR